MKALVRSWEGTFQMNLSFFQTQPKPNEVESIISAEIEALKFPTWIRVSILSHAKSTFRQADIFNQRRTPLRYSFSRNLGFRSPLGPCNYALPSDLHIVEVILFFFVPIRPLVCNIETGKPEDELWVYDSCKSALCPNGWLHYPNKMNVST